MGSSVPVSPPATSSAAFFLKPTCLIKLTVVIAAWAWALMTATNGPPSMDSKSMLASSCPGFGISDPPQSDCGVAAGYSTSVCFRLRPALLGDDQLDTLGGAMVGLGVVLVLLGLHVGLHPLHEFIKVVPLQRL